MPLWPDDEFVLMEFGIRETVSWGFGCSGGEEAGRPGLCVPSRNPVVGVASEILIKFGIADGPAQPRSGESSQDENTARLLPHSACIWWVGDPARGEMSDMGLDQSIARHSGGPGEAAGPSPLPLTRTVAPQDSYVRA